MKTKWKVIVSIMLLIIIICTIFAILVLKQHDDKVQEIIEGKNESATLLADTLLDEFSNRYKYRIRSFSNSNVSASREEMIRAFAERDRDKLYLLSNRLLTALKKENSYFSTMGWILPDNTVFLRTHDGSGKSGKNVSKMRPDIVAVNRDQRQYSGFNAGHTGMQYRVVHPVFYQVKYIGATQFGIKASVIFDALQNKLNAIAGIAVLNRECETVKESKVPKLRCRTHTIRSRDAELFKPIQNQLDWDKPQQEVVINGKAHIIINVLPVANYQDENLGSFFVALDVSEELAQKQKLIVTIRVVSATLLILSFLILYFSYGSLVQKIIILNQSLEKSNLELEDRVHERTVKLQESEKQLHRAQKMESIGLMAGGVAHDLNNILSGIVGYPELILHNLPEDSELRKPIEAIQESGKRAATVVADLLTVARGAASTREVCDIHSLVEEYLHSPECEKLKALYPHVKYLQQFSAVRSTISCSPVHVKKCIMNLVTNAAEAVAEAGTVTISTVNHTVDTAKGTQLNIDPGDYVIINVKDSGPGISNDDLEHVFEPFYSKKIMGRSGTGLGLTVVWNTMEDHGGIVLAESSEKGTCFQLYFPVSKEKETVPVSSEDVVMENGGNKQILVVDDEDHLRDIAAQMLGKLGYIVHTVSSGEKALEFVKDNKVDLIVLDMLMDPGINGRETYEEILKLYPDQKAIVASGFSESEDVKATLRLGAGGFIKKPYSMNQLGRVIEEALNC